MQTTTRWQEITPLQEELHKETWLPELIPTCGGNSISEGQKVIATKLAKPSVVTFRFI